MKSQRLARATVPGIVLIALVAFSGLAFDGSDPVQKTGYKTAMKELRDRFNADKSKVRLLMLLSPT